MALNPLNSSNCEQLALKGLNAKLQVNWTCGICLLHVHDQLVSFSALTLLVWSSDL